AARGHGGPRLQLAQPAAAPAPAAPDAGHGQGGGRAGRAGRTGAGRAGRLVPVLVGRQRQRRRLVARGGLPPRVRGHCRAAGGRRLRRRVVRAGVCAAGVARVGHVRPQDAHGRVGRRDDPVCGGGRARRQRRAGRGARPAGAAEAQVPGAVVRRPVHAGRRGGRAGAGRADGALAPGPLGLQDCRALHARRPAARRRAGRRPRARHLLPHGLRRPGNRRADWRARAGPLPPDAQRLRRAVERVAHGLHKLLLHRAARRQVGAQEVGRPVPVRRQAVGRLHDAARRHGPQDRPGLPPPRREIRRRPGRLLRRLCPRLRQAARAGRQLPRRRPRLR
ncbi:hypothetical protein LPJ70_007732, partial [Coemansia sp. RSA 2708]